MKQRIFFCVFFLLLLCIKLQSQSVFSPLFDFDSTLLNSNAHIFLDDRLKQNIYENGHQGTSPATVRNIFMTVDASGWEGRAANHYRLIDRSGNGTFFSEDFEFYVPDFLDTK